jgi:PAS domain S-box-containing protein
MTEVGESGRYRRLVEESRDIIAVVDTDGTVTYVNRAVERVLGYDPAAVVGNDGIEYTHPDDRETVATVLETMRTAPDEPRTVELRVRRADGSWCWLEATVRSRGGGDATSGIIVNGRDITERKERKADLVTTKQRMELALEGANLGIWDWDMRTDEVSRDELLTEMLGYTQAEMGDRMRGWERVVHPADRKRHDEALAEHVAERTPYYRCDHRLKTKSGTWKWVRTMGKVVERDEDGEPVRAVGIHQDIDDRKRVELALKQERDMFKEGPTIVFKWEDTEGWPIEYVSENVEEKLGYTPDELRSREIEYADLIHGEDRKRVAEEASELDAEGVESITLDPYRVITASGDVRWVKEYTRAVESGSDPDQLLGYLVDVTDHKRREVELRQFKAAVERSAHAIYITDDEGTIEYVNPAFEAITGYSEDAAVGDTPHILNSGTYDDEFYEEFWETIRSGERWEAEMVDEGRDGERIVLDQTVAPITDDDGDVRKFIAVAREITDRKEREQKLREREQKYRSLFEGTRDALMLLNRDGFFDCNEQTLELFGADSVESFAEYTPWDLSPPQQPDGRESEKAALEHVETAFEEGEAFFEWTHQRVDNTTFPAEVKLSRFEYEGEPTFLGLVRDISERKEYERRLEEQRDNLEVLNRVLRHDIRNDLQMVTAYTRMLADDGDEAEMDDHLETVLERADHAVELTNVAREMADVMLSTDQDLEHADLRTTLRSELAEVQSIYPEADIGTETTVPRVTVEANDMLNSVFRNLLKNAIQHNDAETPKVTVSVSDHGDAVTVRVADNGPGIPGNQRAQIFGKGEKGLDSQGTGIGLYLVDTLVENYGGEIGVEDSDDGGAAFVVELPKAE